MQFLEERNFTKEEIFGKLAPGLASVLAVNATEANALAGNCQGVVPFMSRERPRVARARRPDIGTPCPPADIN